jgi:small-conductance mechanosensitive channel
LISRLIEAFLGWPGALRFSATFAGIAAAAWCVKAALFRMMRRAAEKTETDLDDRVLASLKWPARLLVILVSLLGAVHTLDEREIPRVIESSLGVAVEVLLVAAVTLALARASVILLEHAIRASEAGIEVTTLTKMLVQLFWAVPAVLIILRIFNLTITPALTALGVGGLAVSLALQPTLVNLFAGFQVSLAGQLHRGDYVKLDSGAEGYVEDIRWRVTTLRTLQQNLVYIPNSKLAEALLTNFSQPARPLAVPIQLGVGYSTDIDRLEQIVLEEAAAAAGEVDGLLAEPPPRLRFNPGFGDSALNFTLIVHARDFESQFNVTDQVRRRLFKRFQREGITIPFPIRTLDIPPGALRRATGE